MSIREKALKINILNFHIFAITLLVILSSKTVFFGVLKPNKYFTLGLLFAACIGVLLNRKFIISKVNFLRICILLILMFMSILWNLSSLDKTYINGIIGFVLVLIEALIITTQCSKTKFKIYSVNIITIISLISLFSYIIIRLSPNLIDFFGPTQYQVENTSSIIYSPFYTWGWWYVWDRNAGMWTEPGFFQMFITFTILMIASEPREIKHANLKLIILLVTLLTTSSTSAYIAILLIFLLYMSNYKESIISIKNKRNLNGIKIFIIIIIIIGIIIYIINSKVIQEKLFTENVSMQIRVIDLIQSINIIVSYPLFGIGWGEIMETIVQSYGIMNNSNGLFVMAYIWGVPFTLFYIYEYIRGTISFFAIKTFPDKIYITLLIILLFMTQAFWWYPFFSIFLFEWTNDKVLISDLNYNVNTNSLY